MFIRLFNFFNVLIILKTARRLDFGFASSGLFSDVIVAAPAAPFIEIVCVFSLIFGSAIIVTSVLFVPRPAKDKAMEMLMFFGNFLIASKAGPEKITFSS